MLTSARLIQFETTGAAAAGAAGLGGMAGVASGVAGAGIATQAGIAVGVAAATAAAVSSGVKLNSDPTPAAVDRYGDFVPPRCSKESEKKIGALILDIQGIPPGAMKMRKQALEILFREIYNEITGMCLDPYNRVLHYAEIYKWNTTFGEGYEGFAEYANQLDSSESLPNATKYNFTDDEYRAAVKSSTTSTYWTAKVECLGCPDYEPLFAVADNGTRRLTVELTLDHMERLLQLSNMDFEMDDFFVLFAASFGYNIGPVLAGKDGEIVIPGSIEDFEFSGVQVVYGSTRQVNADGEIDENSPPISFVGNESIQEVLEVGKFFVIELFDYYY